MKAAGPRFETRLLVKLARIILADPRVVAFRKEWDTSELLFEVVQSRVKPLLESYEGGTTGEHFVVDTADITRVSAQVGRHLAQAAQDDRDMLVNEKLWMVARGDRRLFLATDWSVQQLYEAPLQTDFGPNLYAHFVESAFGVYFTEHQHLLPFIGVTLQEYYLLAVFLWYRLAQGGNSKTPLVLLASDKVCAARMRFLRDNHTLIHFEHYGSEDYNRETMEPMMRLTMDVPGHVIMPHPERKASLGLMKNATDVTDVDLVGLVAVASTVDKTFPLGACSHCDGGGGAAALLCEAPPSTRRFCDRGCQEAYYNARAIL